jgi:hypothetical protein
LRHFEEEENGLFPKVREAMDNARLNELGNELEKARKVAPTRPQPHATDELPKMMNMGAADRARETGRATRGARATARGGAKRAAKSASKRATAGKRAAGGRRARSGSRAQAR